MSNPTDINAELAELLEIDDSVLRTSDSPTFGVTKDGFVCKSFVRLLAEKLALARELFDSDIDLTSGSAIRKLLELSAIEDARTWASVAAMYDNGFVHTANGDALTLLGNERGVPRPFMEATGSVTLTLAGELPADLDAVHIPRGARMLTQGGHHVAIDESVALSPSTAERTVRVRAFYPGADGNLNPSHETQVIDTWNPDDDSIAMLVEAQEAGEPLVQITHDSPLTGGEQHWSDARYRKLLLQAPRSLWTVEAIRLAASLVAGVRQVQVHDPLGGLDIYQSIFGNFNFIERVFGTERDLGSPYYFTVMVAPTASAIWGGPHGLQEAVASAIEEFRPIGIFPQVEKATEVFVGVKADLIVEGLPLPSGSKTVVNSSAPARELKTRLCERIQRYIDRLEFGEEVSAAQVTWELINEQYVVDIQNLRLLRFPPDYDNTVISEAGTIQPVEMPIGANIEIQAQEIPVFVDDSSRLIII